MQIFTNIEIDDAELWEAVSDGVEQSIAEQVPDLLDELEVRAELLEETASDLEYRIADLEDNSGIDKEMISALEAQVQDLENQVIRPEYLVERIRQLVADALADARIILWGRTVAKISPLTRAQLIARLLQNGLSESLR